MARSIQFNMPNLAFGTFGMANITMDVVLNGVPTSSKVFYFNIGEFSAYIDNINTSCASLHFGRHSITINSADYDTFVSPNGTVTSPATLVGDVAQVISDLAA